jgi:uncharacterized glyoxalase superfamily metalloenzyme YdcJ
VAFVEPWQLRARFARSLSAMYGREVPAYATLVEVAHEVNDAVVAARGADAQRLGALDRVTAERHGAIRLGTPRELEQVARIFGAMGMFAVGFYDLREAAPSPVPVVSTAFRPLDARELARDPFRVFTSLLAVSDRRFFTAELQHRLERFLGERVLFTPVLLALADRAEAEHGLAGADADRFVALATRAFELSREPVDEPWYRALERISAVAADIGGVTSTHINHLTPRVLDIDELYARMQARGIEMIDAIQGPPRWDGPDVLLRQTSFRALAEPRAFRRADGSVHQASLRVRFGEVEARGVALTPAGRGLYDDLAAEHADGQRWGERFPATERALIATDLAYFEYELVDDRRPDATHPPADAGGLVDGGWVTAHPVVYEDFLPASAAGIFGSNLGKAGSQDFAAQAADLHAGWLAGALGRELADPFALYAAQRDRSLDAVRRTLTPDLSRS